MAKSAAVWTSERMPHVGDVDHERGYCVWVRANIAVWVDGPRFQVTRFGPRGGVSYVALTSQELSPDDLRSVAAAVARWTR